MTTKRFLSLFIALVLCLSSFTAFAADELTDEKQKDKLKVFYNDEIIKFDVEPVIENGRTLVPLRAIFETFGAQVSWDAATSTVTAKKGDTEVKLTIDNDLQLTAKNYIPMTPQ